MQIVEVTPRVWDRILTVRSGRACTCCGRFSDTERAALDLYGPLARRDLGPMTFAQIGQSLDGRVATASGDARDVSGPEGLAHLHRLRALVDGVVIGVGTALHDTPRLTVRLCSGHNPARIVIDPRGRLPDDAPVLRDDGARRVVVQSVRRPRPDGVEVLHLPLTDGRLDPAAILQGIRNLDIGSLLIEGGGSTITNFLEDGLLDRLQVSVSPLIIGNGPQGLTTRSPVDRLSDAIRPDTRVFNIGGDIVFDCALAPRAAAACRPLHTAQDGRERNGMLIA
ncbi:RibD family protein [Paracoccus sp. 1_MG-2023]|uniref:RibD family protein n=1 Tax=unclassified Paracoccus (in: a-proteobacteria) TaxID=2688777 RepID=UPI001C0A29A8|nr:MULTISPECIES: RibD family protein [unclassified Paracoccus (in: a-proteobacteria)]MBU2958462.1 RibD family protein [Paracoccus sp. C2R09]MDO6668553.1 RibD family protein [Paracoccus sp. 1_MG-2023]